MNSEKDREIIMIRVTEIQYALNNAYKKEFLDGNGNVIGEKKIVISKGCIFKDEFKYLILFQSDGTTIREAYRYLNVELRGSTINSRLQVCAALRLLYSFLEIHSYTLDSLGNDEIKQLKEFLIGGTREGIFYNIEKLTKRANETVNTYITHYRSYLNFLGIKNKILNEKRTVTVENVYSANITTTRYNSFTKYKVNLNVGAKKQTVPMYIKEKEYDKIIKYIKESGRYGVREEVIIRLMFENGLRLGEVLGITLEDLDESKIYIRNRLSDKQYQQAKTAMKIERKDVYSSEAYKTYKIGYSVIKPKRVTLSKIKKYLSENSIEYMKDRCRKNYLKNATADTVGNGYGLEEGNYYIFLNKYGNPLSYNGWNKILRSIFKEVGIIVDKDKRNHNLNHRFRHGFAMKMVKNGDTPLEIKEALRNHSLNSVDYYFRPTEEDVYDANKHATDTMEEYLDVEPDFLENLNKK